MKLEIVLGKHQCLFQPWTVEQGRVFNNIFAFDTETTKWDEDRPYLPTSLVLATACDGTKGFIIPRRLISAFLAAHDGSHLIFHNAAFDLKVTQACLGSGWDLYEGVDQGRFWDTLILKRLYSLATAGHTARGEASLDHCAAVHLGLMLPKDLRGPEGEDVRTGFGKFLGQPLEAVPEVYFRYACSDPLATWLLFWELKRLIKDVLDASRGVWGFVSDDWLREAIRLHGPLSHHIQLRASILMDAISASGIAIDASRRDERKAQLDAVKRECQERMRRRGFLVGEPGSAKAMQSILKGFARDRPDLDLKRTESGKSYSTAERDLAQLAEVDPFFADYSRYRTVEKLLSTYLAKMGQQRVHPRFGYLLETGRTYCGGGINLQNLPKEKDQSEAASTIRGAFVPPTVNDVFIDCDYAQIELVVLAHVVEKQFGQRSALRRLINGGDDIHRIIAATVLGKDAGSVTKAERDSAKPVSFGRPGGMGPERLQAIAKASYGIDLSLEQVAERIAAYHRLCPELDHFLEDESSAGQVLADALQLTPGGYARATGRDRPWLETPSETPEAWIGAMLLKVLREPIPCTQGGNGRPYQPLEIEYFWNQVQPLTAELKLDGTLQARLERHEADPQLWRAVRDWAGRRPVFTITGRLCAGATFCSARNCVFQGAAADGAILGMWLVWRAGHKIVSFVHDQNVVESPADDLVLDRCVEIEGLMKRGMETVVPGMCVKVETVVTRSLNKSDLDPRYGPSGVRLGGVKGPRQVSTRGSGRSHESPSSRLDPKEGNDDPAARSRKQPKARR